MRQLVSTPAFERAFRCVVRRNGVMQALIEETLRRMEANLEDPRLRTHHLSGKLSGLFACSCGYDCRIVFAKERNAETGHQVLLLINIGTHDDVY